MTIWGLIFRTPYLEIYRTVFGDFGVILKHSSPFSNDPEIVENGAVELKIQCPRYQTFADSKLPANNSSTVCSCLQHPNFLYRTVFDHFWVVQKRRVSAF